MNMKKGKRKRKTRQRNRQKRKTVLCSRPVKGECIVDVHFHIKR